MRINHMAFADNFEFQITTTALNTRKSSIDHVNKINIVDKKNQQKLKLTPPNSENIQVKTLCDIVKAYGIDYLTKPHAHKLLEDIGSLSNCDLFYIALHDKDERQHINALCRENQSEIISLLEDDIAYKNTNQLRRSHCDSHHIQKHSIVKEANNSGMEFVTKTPFESWEKTVKHTPDIIFLPKSVEGIKNLIKWVNKYRPQQRIRPSGYRHSSSELHAEDGHISVSMLDLHTATKLPAPHPLIPSNNEMQFIQTVGQAYEKNGQKKIQCKFGASTCNYHFQDWVHDKKGGNLRWAMPANVIMTEVTFAGVNAPICHGAGITNKTISDLVTEIEFINIKGEKQTVRDPELLKAAAGCFGLLGIVTSITLELDELQFANFKTVKKELLSLAIPPAEDFLPSENLINQLSKENKDALKNKNLLLTAFEDFKMKCETSYYSEWFWFPLQDKCLVNCWNKSDHGANAVRYPGNLNTQFERIGAYLGHLSNGALSKFGGGIAKLQTKLLGHLAMNLFPDKQDITCSIEDALHIRQGIQNVRTRMIEIEIPIPDTFDKQPDWSICQKAWWAVIESVYSEHNMEYFPMRTTLEMRITGGSDILMAPQYGNKRTCAIEVLTPVAVDHKIWDKFIQEVLDKWSLLKDCEGRYLNIRPHWAKRFDKLIIKRPLDWLNEWDETTHFNMKDHLTINDQMVYIPFLAYLKFIAFKDQIPLFKNELSKICNAGGYTLEDICTRFSNPFLDEVFQLNKQPLLEKLNQGKAWPQKNSVFLTPENLHSYKNIINYIDHLRGKKRHRFFHHHISLKIAQSLEIILTHLNSNQSIPDIINAITQECKTMKNPRTISSVMIGEYFKVDKIVNNLIYELSILSDENELNKSLQTNGCIKTSVSL